MLKNFLITLFSVLSLSVGLVAANTPPSTSFVNRIDGVVYDPNHNPVNDVPVELLNEVGSLLTTSRTSAGGRFSFMNVSAGRFLIKVVPVGLNYLEETASVEVVNFGRNGGSSSDTAYVDVYLKPDKRRAESLVNRPAEAIFVQDVPDAAKKLLESGRAEMRKDPAKGTADVQAALAVFPTYFEALNTLGYSYSLNKEYAKAYPYFLKAIDVNPRSFMAYYYAGLCFYHLNEVKAGLAAARSSVILAPTFFDAQVLLGSLLRMDGKYKEAEDIFLKVKSQSPTPNPEVCWQLALLYNKQGRNVEAVKLLETYLAVDPNNPDKKKVQDLIAKLKATK